MDIAELFARATPLLDDTGYVMARFTNTSSEPLLVTQYMRQYFDGGLVGANSLNEAIVPDQEVELGFGQIPGLQLDHKVLTRNEGDRGIISKSNEQTQDERIEITNLTDRTWDVEVRHSVPYSEQEDLVISYAADPRPDVQAVDDKRGILQWNVEMEPGNEATITVGQKIKWPEGKVLR